MKNIICSFLFILIISSLSLYAQQEEVENSLVPGSWSLQFRVEKDFTIGDFLGSNFSGKYHFTENSALRIGVGFSGQSIDKEWNRGGSIKDETDRFFVDLFGQYLYYFNPKKEINFFIGSGLRYGVGKFEFYEQDIRGIDSIVSIETSSQEGTEWSLGLNFVIGTEWFVSKSISFLAEYQTNLSYSMSESETRRKRILNSSSEYFELSNSKSEGIIFGSGSVKLGLSVYF